MTKPNDIPFEVWTAAERFLADWERPRPAGFVMEFEDWIDQVARAMMLATAQAEAKARGEYPHPL